MDASQSVNFNNNFVLPSGQLHSEVIPCPNIKISSVFERVIKSRLVLEMIMAAAIVIAATVTFGPVGLVSFPVVLGLLTVSIFADKRMKYEASIIGTALQPSTNTLGHEIIPGCLTLGPGPLKNKNDHYKILDAGITFILTLLEDFEWETPGLFSEPMLPEDWRQLAQYHLKNITQKIIRTPDFNPLSLEDIQEGVEALRKEIQENKGHVYVHCKAGRGRSATIVICYLLKYGKLYHGINVDLSNPDAAIKYAKDIRNEININKYQHQAIEDFFDDMLEIKPLEV